LRWQRWWSWWRQHVRGLISTWLFWRPVGHHNLGNVCYRKWRQRKWRDRKWRDRKERQRTWRHFPAFCLTIVVVQNVPLLFVIRFTASDYSFGIFWSLCCLSFDLRLLIIPLVSSSLSCKGTFCTTTIVRKKRRKITSLPVMTSLSVMRLASLPAMTSLPIAHLSQIMMAYRSSKQ
jgi:hypothetical protein